MNSIFSFIVVALALFGSQVAKGQSIIGFTPAFGAVGESIRVTGSGFTGVTNVIFFNNRSVRVTPTSDTQINAVVPAGAVTGPIMVRKGSTIVTSAGDFTVIGQEPYVTDFSPISGSGGTVVTFNGVHFTGITNVTFNGTNGTITQLTSDTQIKVAAPNNVSTGPIRLTRSNLTFTTSSNFFVTPAITSFSPSSARPGTNVVISGKNFVGTTAVRFGGMNTVFFVDSNTQITTSVPAGANTGLINVVAPGGQAFSSSNLVVLPEIFGFSPTKGKAGTNVTITGANLLGNPVVRFNGVAAPIVGTPTSSQIIVSLPAAAVTGPVSVTTTNGTFTTSSNFFVAPIITSFTPASGAPGTEVGIYGTSFTNATEVAFNGAPASFTLIESNVIFAIVPADATSGLISVTAPGGTGLSTTTFFVSPRITGFTPGSGIPGTTVIISGSSFTNVTEIRFNGVSAASFTAESQTQISAIVPDGATTGPISVITPGGTNVSAQSFIISPLVLTISRVGERAVAVSWPTSAVAFALQTKTNVAATNWVTVSSFPAVVNGRNVVTNQATNAAVFFRLKK